MPNAAVQPSQIILVKVRQNKMRVSAPTDLMSRWMVDYNGGYETGFKHYFIIETLPDGVMKPVQNKQYWYDRCVKNCVFYILVMYKTKLLRHIPRHFTPCLFVVVEQKILPFVFNEVASFIRINW